VAPSKKEALVQKRKAYRESPKFNQIGSKKKSFQAKIADKVLQLLRS
jgi:hypothetical protein